MKFVVFNSKGSKGEIEISNIKNETVTTKIEIKSLKFKGFEIENVVAKVVFTASSNNVCLELEDGKLLTITNQKLIDYIWKESGSNINSTIYGFTTNYKANYLD